jgi:putative Ca2+/H+ antiporter (TMEM165/GDT1 family)
VIVSVLFVSYALVLGAEIVGDKTFYTLGTLATRYRLRPIFWGSTLAFMLKMLAAVALGSAITNLPSILVASLSAGTFFAIALVMWFKKPELDPLPVSAARSSLKIAASAFAGIFFSEWGDVGQLAAATLAARYRLPSVVWAGAVLAMMTKGILAITLGTNLRSRIPREVFRYATFSLCLAMGILAVFRIDL